MSQNNEVFETANLNAPQQEVEVLVNGQSVGKQRPPAGCTLGGFIGELAKKQGVRSFSVYVDGRKALTSESSATIAPTVRQIELVAKDSRGGFRAAVFAGNVAVSPLGSGGTNKVEFEDLKSAKKAIDALLNHASYKASFTNGYLAIIINDETKQMTSFAESKPVPTTKWSDEAASSTAAAA